MQIDGESGRKNEYSEIVITFEIRYWHMGVCRPIFSSFLLKYIHNKILRETKFKTIKKQLFLP